MPYLRDCNIHKNVIVWKITNKQLKLVRPSFAKKIAKRIIKEKHDYKNGLAGAYERMGFHEKTLTFQARKHG